jgi:hypothetical protein
MIEKNGNQGVKEFFQIMDLHLKQECDKENSIRTLKQKDPKRKFRKRRARPNVLTHNMKENPKIKSTRNLSLNESKQQTQAPIPVIRNQCMYSIYLGFDTY